MPSVQKYGDQSVWIKGVADPGVNRLDTGSNSIYWLYGKPYPVLYTQNNEGNSRIRGTTTLTCTPAVTRTGTFTSSGETTIARVILEFGGSETTAGTNMKYWLYGNSFDLIKKLVGGSPSKMVSSALQRKPKIDGYPESIKIVDARMGIKRTTASGGGGSGSSNIKVGDQSRWVQGLPVDGFFKENNA